MIKKICMIAVLVCGGVFAFAQAQPKAVLSKSDIDNFVKNFVEVQETLDAHDDELSSLEMDFSEMEGKSITAAIAKVRSFPVSAGLRTSLARFGLGNNGFEKCMVILYGMSVLYLEEMFAGMSGGGQGALDMGEEMAAMIKGQVAPMKTAIHANDFSLLSSRKGDLLPLFENL